MIEYGARSTGWAILPKHFDPQKILILDVDAYETDRQTIEDTLYGQGVIPPKGHTVVQSASGGLHYWYRLPENFGRIPETYALSGEVKGETRLSSSRNQLAILPGSVVLNKKGQLGKYELLEGDLLDPPLIPESLLARLTARTPVTEHERPSDQKLPTEAEHLLDTIRYIPDGSVKRGVWNIWISQIGQVLGRVWARDRPDDGTVNLFWEVVAPKFDGEADPSEFSTALRSGYQTGRNNQDKYAPRDKHPSATDVTTEIINICRGPLALIENLSQQGKREGYTLLFGGSPKRPHEAKRSLQMKTMTDPDELLGNIVRITDADGDDMAQSPLSRQTNWLKQLRRNLIEARGVDRPGLEVEQSILFALEDLGETAVRQGNIGTKAGEGCPTGSGRSGRGRSYLTSCWWQAIEADVLMWLGTSKVDEVIRNNGLTPSEGKKMISKLGVEGPVSFPSGPKGAKAYRWELRRAPEEFQAMISAELIEHSKRKQEKTVE
jgi:hypothetical protein